MIYKQSPNYMAGRSGKKPDRIVIHWMAGNLAGADARFMNPAALVSAHFGVEDGNVMQWVSPEDTAYHAGLWDFNLRSIGIEHSADPNRPATEQTYRASAAIIKAMAERYGIPLDRQHIVKHSEVVATQCPGTMDLERLIQLAKGEEKPMPAATTPADETVIRLCYNGFLHRDPVGDEWKAHLGQTVEHVMRTFDASAEHQDLMRRAVSSGGLPAGYEAKTVYVPVKSL